MFYFIMALLIISFILTYLRQKRYQDNRDMQLKLRMASFVLLLLVAYFTFFVAQNRRKHQNKVKVVCMLFFVLHIHGNLL